MESEFVAALDHLRRQAAEATGTGNGGTYLHAPERLSEASLVEPCVARFAMAEMLMDDPRQPVGRYSPNSLRLDPPPGRQLRAQLETTNAEVRDAVRRTVIEAVALGYMAAIDAEAMHLAETGDTKFLSVREDRTPEAVWNFWVVSFTDAKEAFDGRYRRDIETIASDRLLASLRELGVLPRFGKRTRLRGTAGTYASAGMMLRSAQSDNLTDEAFEGAWRHMTNMWPYDSYA